MCVATTVARAADVVAHAGALVEARLGDRRAPRVDAHGQVEAGAKFLHDDHHPVEFFGLTHVVTGSGLHAADVEQVGALVHQSLGAKEELVEVEGGGRLEERVSRAVEDPHDERPVGDVVGPRAHREQQRRRRPVDHLVDEVG
jgi:hypothetical protein